MSVAEIAPRNDDFERTPPHDVAAEQCVLGGMLLSKDAISDVIEVLRPTDHYRPAHQLIHEAILDLYSRGEPADAITVANELSRRGEIARVGGGPYLHTLIASVPTAANAGYYARIVRERAILRRLVEAGTRIVQFGYAGEADADDLVDRAQAEVYAVTDRRTSEDYHSLSEIMPGALDEIEAIGSRGGVLTGVPTGFSDLDALTNGLHPGQMIVIAARPAIGKALALDTPLPTPDGWTTMGEVRVGDQLIGADGKAANVVAATDVMPGRPCYQVEFSDGEVIVADAQHLWVTWDRRARQAYDDDRPDGGAYPGRWATWTSSRHRYSELERQPLREPRMAGGQAADAGRSAGAGEPRCRRAASDRAAEVRVVPRTTEEIASTLLARGEANHAIPAAAALELPEADLAIEPYVLGYLLGGGDSAGTGRVACDPQDRDWLLEEFRAAGHQVAVHADAGHVEVKTVQQAWRSLGLTEARHIPAAYIRASFRQRLALAQGLVDSGGYIDGRGAYRFSDTSKQFVDDFTQLVVSLGCVPQVHRRPRRVRGARLTRQSWEVMVPTATPLARLSRKALAARREWPREQASRYIVSVRPVESRPVRCVQVDSADRMYLASRSMIPTHNSTLALDFARSAAIKHNMATVLFSLEMGRNEITMRLLSAEARVPLSTMRTGQMNDDDWARLARRMSEVADAPLFIDDSPNMSLMEIRAKCRRLKQRNELKIVIIDYLQLMSSPKRVENRQQEVSDMSRSLKLLAKELEVPVIALSQLNRGPEQRTDKKPLLSDLRESGCLTAGTRILRADTGSEITLGDLLTSGEQDVLVWSLDDQMRLVPRTMTHAFPSGTKEVFRVRLASGREVEATSNHPFLTFGGWRPLSDIGVGSRVGVPRHMPAPLHVQEMPEPELVMLAHLLGDGSFVSNQPIRYASIDEASLAAVTAQVFSLPQNQLALFLRHLWTADGSVTIGKSGAVRVHYSTTSERLAREVQMLLLRFGIIARLRAVGNDYGHPRWTVDVKGVKDQRRFLDEIGVHGERGLVVVEARRRLEATTAAGRFDTIPGDVWKRVSQVMKERSVSRHRIQAAAGTRSRGDLNDKTCPTRTRVGRMAEILGDAELELLATNDVFWDAISSIESIGNQPVYDATVLGAHNFVANGIDLHNSIEQDSDLVILLHREDYYERESPRAGEADLIVAKHRNGPTATVTVAFQGHYSRFVDMAPG